MCLLIATLIHLQLVFVLFIYSRQQLSLAPVQSVDEGVALRNQTGLELHSVLLKEKHKEPGKSQQVVLQLTSFFLDESTYCLV